MEQNTISSVILLIHGIRTFGRWQERAKSILEENSSTRCVIVRYGYFDLLRFLIPGLFFRRRVLNRIQSKIRATREAFPNASISFVAHSFGSYCITRLLMTEPDLRFSRALLCGAVVPEEYPWFLVRPRISNSILNFCSRLDPWPYAAQALRIGYGPIGTFGANTPEVEDRFFETSHSGYFEQSIIREKWKPFLETGFIQPAEEPTRKGLASSWAIPIAFMIWLTSRLTPIALIAFIVFSFIPADYHRVDERKWFPEENMFYELRKDMKTENGYLQFRDMKLAMPNTDPIKLHEIQIYFDTLDFSLARQGINTFYKIILDQNNLNSATGQWLVTRPYRPGPSTTIIWRRLEATTTPDEFELVEEYEEGGILTQRKLFSIWTKDTFEQRCEELLNRSGLSFNDLFPVLVLGVDREQWTYVDSARSGSHFLNFQLTTVHSYGLWKNASLPKIANIPFGPSTFSWFEIELELRGWTMISESLRGEEAGRLGVHSRTLELKYNLSSNDDSGPLPKYHQALMREAEGPFKGVSIR